MSSSTRHPTAPRISVVVIPGADAARVWELLTSVAPLCESYAVEVLVVGAGSERLGGAFPEVRLVVPPPDAAGPRDCRRIGMKKATGDVVLFVSDSDPDAHERVAGLIAQCQLAPARPAPAAERRPARAPDPQADEPLSVTP